MDFQSEAASNIAGRNWGDAHRLIPQEKETLKH